jgi:hypothetical protein
MVMAILKLKGKKRGKRLVFGLISFVQILEGNVGSWRLVKEVKCRGW